MITSQLLLIGMRKTREMSVDQSAKRSLAHEREIVSSRIDPRDARSMSPLPREADA
jgi:hypothetical protein